MNVHSLATLETLAVMSTAVAHKQSSATDISESHQPNVIFILADDWSRPAWPLVILQRAVKIFFNGKADEVRGRGLSFLDDALVESTFFGLD
jgi:hypothetical protein